MNTTRVRGALRLAASGSPSARDLVTGTLVDEHRTLRTVLQILQRLLHEISQFGMTPDFSLLSAILYYIDDFPERVHHPKEDRHLFPVLRRRTARFDGVIARLRTDHARIPQMFARIQRDFVHYQAGAPQGLARLCANVGTYAELLEEHMRTEEELLHDARAELTEEDWEQLARAVRGHGDPLRDDPTRQEFRVLRARILNLLPTKMRLDATLHDGMRGPHA